MERKFDWNDILITPAEFTDINSRSEVIIEKLPLYVSPMDTVVDINNFNEYLENGFEVCLPRDIKYIDNISNLSINKCFFSYGLDEFIEKLDNGYKFPKKVLIDIANGHMKKLYYTVKKFKKIFPDKILMVGNIANPNTYKELSLAGADIIRVGIGHGGGCLTSQNSSIGYPMASLINECYQLKDKHKLKSIILADGGFREYSDIIKSLALGSDSVMLGSILNKTIESSGDNYIFNGKIKIPRNLSKFLYNRNFKITKKFRGMSTKEVQKKWGRSKLKTSEGVVRYRLVEYNIKGWVENFIDYLKSNMSYCNCRNLNEYIGKVNYTFITSESLNRFKK